jgi:hypothetical protein
VSGHHVPASLTPEKVSPGPQYPDTIEVWVDHRTGWTHWRQRETFVYFKLIEHSTVIVFYYQAYKELRNIYASPNIIRVIK